LRLTQIAFALIALTGMMACSQKSAEDCGFVQNVYGERISWKDELPVHLAIHESVPAEYRPAILSAADRWNRASGRTIIQIDDAVVTGDATASKDGKNVIYMNNTWEANKATEQGRTSVYWIGDRVREADIKINAQNFQFYWQKTTQTQAVNIEALVVHEMGHVLGLKHKDTATSVMQTYLASNTDRTQIGTTDLESLKCEY
jgi:hypothetical protein